MSKHYRKRIDMRMEELGKLYELAQPEVEQVSDGITVVRVYCHSGMEDFEWERCPRCGMNVYDWILGYYDE
jgi:hypothetical protein